MALSKDLLAILACPKCVREPGCTGDLEYHEEKQQLICRHCKLIYSIKDDIPVMLVEEATFLEE
ncbi:MAG: Trm112 family protein [Deltaproteobacteria bacterium]|nr:Trm112 family protein [Deltaproteobacteria bacterium]